MTKTVQIKNTRPRIVTAEGLELHPGTTDVPEATAKKFLANPVIKTYIARDFIVVEGKAKAKADNSEAEKEAAEKAAAKAKAKEEAAAAQAKLEAEEKAKLEAEALAAEKAKEEANGDSGEDDIIEPPYGIKGLSAAESIDAIKEIEDAEYLQRVLDGSESRSTVREALEKRLSELKD